MRRDLRDYAVEPTAEESGRLRRSRLSLPQFTPWGFDLRTVRRTHMCTPQKATVFFSILCSIVLLQSAALAGLNFSKPRKFAVSPLPDAIALGDFNHDGKLDLAVSSCNSVSLNVLLGNGDGTFQPAVSYSAG